MAFHEYSFPGLPVGQWLHSHAIEGCAVAVSLGAKHGHSTAVCESPAPQYYIGAYESERSTSLGDTLTGLSRPVALPRFPLSETDGRNRRGDHHAEARGTVRVASFYIEFNQLEAAMSSRSVALIVALTGTVLTAQAPVPGP